MNLNNFTIKAQEAVQQAVQLVTKNNQQVIEPVHLLKAVIMTGESVTNFIFQKLGVNAQNLNMVLDRQIESYPKVSGGEPYLSSESNAVLQKAIDYSSKMGDQYVSLEPIILALFTEKSTASQILKDAGVTEKELRQAIEELRKGNKVTSQSAEDTYDALGKYAINLNERARSGKLDPVIGRDEEIRRVCHYVNADHFIDKLDHGLDEEVRERGNNFSAGQRQLLSFARTIIHKPSVMILDEATANIDTETELLIQDSLEKMRSVGTMLMVAHRLSTIQHADNIIVLSHGKILEQGTHQELLAKHGRYYQLYTLQYHKEQMGE